MSSFGLDVLEISDPADSRLADFRGLTDVALRTRLEPPLGLFIAEGSLVIQRALSSGHRLRSALVSPRWLPVLASDLEGCDGAIYVAPEDVLREITGFHVHRGALASMHRMPPLGADAVTSAARRVVVVEDMVSHTNLGAIFRSAAALGIDGVLLSPSCADPLYRRSVRVSMGGVFAVPWARLSQWPESLTVLRAAGFETVALTPSPSAADLRDVAETVRDRRVAILLGTEGAGLSEPAMGASTLLARIPMSAGIDSLNVAAAAAVAFYAFASV